MKRINIYTAQPIANETVESATLTMDKPIPDIKNLSDAQRLYKREAVRIVKLLRATLPGGTFDQVLIEMLKHKATSFRVRL